MKPLLILAGALFTGASCMAAGLLLIRRLQVKLYRQEVFPYAFVTGSALFSTLVFLLTAANLAYLWTFLLSGGALITTAVATRAYKRNEPPLPPMPGFWATIFGLAIAVYGALYLMHAMAPEFSPDGSSYHLGLVSRYLRQHGFGRLTTNMYANLSMGIEMLFLSSFAIGRHSAAAVTHLLFLFTLPFLMLTFARRNGMPVAGVAAALLVFCSPVFGIDAASAYIDVGMAAVVFACFGMVNIWGEERSRGTLILAGLLAGFAYATKLTAFLAVPYVLGYVVYKQYRNRLPVLRPVLIAGCCAALLIAPWIVKNIVLIGNPFSPFLNRYFPNPYVHISLEKEWSEGLRKYENITSPLQIPMEVTVRGATLNGLLGPIFLLAPIALFAARWPLGRRVLLAAALFASTYPANIGTRFLIAATPFIALAMAMVLQHWRLAAAVVLFHAVISWPDVIRLYSVDWSWRIDKFRWREALRLHDEDTFLRTMAPGYAMSQLVNQHVPPDGKVLQYHGVAEAYAERDILTCYQAGLNNALCEFWASGTQGYMLPSRQWNFRFPETKVRKVRVYQTSRTDQLWGVSEVRLLSALRELPRQPGWRITASPNPWDVQWAFDGCPTTRWRSWQTSEPGMYIEVDLGASTPLTGAVVDITGDNPDTAGRIDAQDEAGNWRTLSNSSTQTAAPPVVNPRRTAMEDIKRYGITHLVVHYGEFISKDMFENRKAWGVTLLGEAGECRLYRID